MFNIVLVKSIQFYSCFMAVCLWEIAFRLSAVTTNLFQIRTWWTLNVQNICSSSKSYHSWWSIFLCNGKVRRRSGGFAGYFNAYWEELFAFSVQCRVPFKNKFVFIVNRFSIVLLMVNMEHIVVKSFLCTPVE